MEAKLVAKLTKALELKSQEHNLQGLDKLGLLRGGSAGVETEDGEILGKCPRVAHLRQIGVEEEKTVNSKIQFEAGYANEEIVKSLLQRTLEPGEELSSTEDIVFELPNGLRVGARPDLLLKRGGQPSRGIELKSIASFWTAKDVHYELKPKSDHLIQAGFYSLAYGKLPWTLLYSNYAQFHLSTAPAWLQKKFTKGTADVEFTEKGPLKVLAFFREYELTWQGENLCYQTEGLDKPVLTDVNLKSFERFYQRVEDLKKGLLSPRPSSRSVDGSSSYNPCDYCSLKSVCDTKEKGDYEQWLDAVLVTPGFKVLKA
jgi:hypothetical protein